MIYIFSNSKRMRNTFSDFVNGISKDPKVRIETNIILDRYNRLPYNYHTKIGYDTLTQNVILKEMINILGPTITDLDKELKMQISTIKYLEGTFV